MAIIVNRNNGAYMGQLTATTEAEQVSTDIYEKSPDELQKILIDVVNYFFPEENRESTEEAYTAKISRLAEGPLLEAIKNKQVNIDLHTAIVLKNKDYVLAQVLFKAGASAQGVAEILSSPMHWDDGGITLLSKLLSENLDVDLGEKIDPLKPLTRVAYFVGEALPDQRLEAVTLLINHLSAKGKQSTEDINAIYKNAERQGFLDAIVSYAEKHGQTRFVDKLFHKITYRGKIVREYFNSLSDRAQAKGDRAFVEALSKFGEVYAEELRNSGSVQEANQQVIEYVRKSLNKEANVAKVLVPFMLAVERGWIDSKEAGVIPLLVEHLPLQANQLISAQLEQRIAETTQTLNKAAESDELIKAIFMQAVEHEQIEVAYKLAQYTSRLQEVYNGCIEYIEYVRTVVSGSASMRVEKGISEERLKGLLARLASIFEILKVVFDRLGLAFSTNLNTRSKREQNDEQRGIELEEIRSHHHAVPQIAVTA